MEQATRKRVNQTSNSNSRRKPKKPVRQNFDYVLLTVVLFLLGFGLLMIYSASSYEASINWGSADYYLIKQAKAIGLGLLGLIILSRIPPYPFYKKAALIIWILSLITVCLVKTKLGYSSHGATRWLRIGPLSFQPAEFVKLAIIILEASLATKMGKGLETFKGFLFYIFPPLLSSGMIYIITKNLSSAIIIMGIAVCILFVSVPDVKWFAIFGAIFGIIVTTFILYVVNNDIEGDFRLGRIKAWLNPNQYSTDESYQTLQALYAIGSGGIWGKGLGQSMQKRRFLPEAQNDMIFSIICEELGLFGAIAVLILFVILIWSCMVIANNTIDRYGSLLVVGVMSHYAIQVVLNVAVVTNSIPNTGVTLPFISYGGSAILFLLAEIGIVLNVSQRAKVVT